MLEKRTGSVQTLEDGCSALLGDVVELSLKSGEVGRNSSCAGVCLCTCRNVSYFNKS